MSPLTNRLLSRHGHYEGGSRAVLLTLTTVTRIRIRQVAACHLPYIDLTPDMGITAGFLCCAGRGRAPCSRARAAPCPWACRAPWAPGPGWPTRTTHPSPAWTGSASPPPRRPAAAHKGKHSMSRTAAAKLCAQASAGARHRHDGPGARLRKPLLGVCHGSAAQQRQGYGMHCTVDREVACQPERTGHSVEGLGVPWWQRPWLHPAPALRPAPKHASFMFCPAPTITLNM